MSRPFVLLDVDGVLNALGRDDAWLDRRSGHAVAEGRRYPIRWSPTVVSRVVGWTEVADVLWLTTWGHDANRSLRHLLGMPELPVAGTYDDPDDARGDAHEDGARSEADSHAAEAPAAPDALTGQWWKFDVVRRLVRAFPGRPLVWLDDDLAGARPMAVWVQQHVAASLLVAPDPASGLTGEDLEHVDAFLAAADGHASTAPGPR